MNMTRCMILSCRLPLIFWYDAVQYSDYVLDRSPTDANTDKGSPLQLRTKKAPTIGEIVSFGSPCTVFQDTRMEMFAQRGQSEFI